jgi:hypothetical protein
MHQAYHNEVTAPITTLTGAGPDPFMPAPETWRSMMRLPDAIKMHWVESLKKEIKALISKETFVPETPCQDDVITPVTAKFCVKLQAFGSIDKLKTRIALRGDLLKELIDAPDTWCRIAGFLPLKMFLAMATYYKERIYQLNHVSAFLQADCVGRKFTIPRPVPRPATMVWRTIAPEEVPVW